MLILNTNSLSGTFPESSKSLCCKKLLVKVSSESEAWKVQKLSNKLYDWAIQNNMDFNSLKFVVLRYGPNEELKNETIYFSDQMKAPIDSLECHKDLGVTM